MRPDGRVRTGRHRETVPSLGSPDFVRSPDRHCYPPCARCRPISPFGLADGAATESPRDWPVHVRRYLHAWNTAQRAIHVERKRRLVHGELELR